MFNSSHFKKKKKRKIHLQGEAKGKLMSYMVSREIEQKYQISQKYAIVVSNVESGNTVEKSCNLKRKHF